MFLFMWLLYTIATIANITIQIATSPFGAFLGAVTTGTLILLAVRRFSSRNGEVA